MPGADSKKLNPEKQTGNDGAQHKAQHRVSDTVERARRNVMATQRLLAESQKLMEQSGDLLRK